MRKLHAHRLDLALVLLAVVVIVTSLGESLVHARYGAAGISAAVLVLLLRHWRPPAAALVSFGLIAGGSRLAPQISGAMFVAILACFAVAGTLPRRGALVAWAAGCLAMVVAMVGNPYVEGPGDIALTLTFCTIIWAAGLYAAERARQAGLADSHARQVEHRRDLDVAEATAQERARIATELHDIVSHGLSIVILQTVAARMSLQDQPTPGPDLDRRLDTVESTARDALDDMRRLLDLLRPRGDSPEGTADDTTPTLGLGQVPALITRAREAGLAVEASYDVAGPELPPGLDAAAYRIVQEAITNVLKHAPGSRARVQVGRTASLLELTIENTTSGDHSPIATGTGHGLIGMRERAELYGGCLRAAATADGFGVTARFPLEEPA